MLKFNHGWGLLNEALSLKTTALCSVFAVHWKGGSDLMGASGAVARNAQDKVPPLFPYYGSKTCMVDTIMALMPSDARVMISPFIGSGVFEYNYAAQHPHCQVLCFDKDPVVVNFHQQALRDRLALHAGIMAAHVRLCGKTVMSKDTHKRLLQQHFAARQHRGMADAVRFYLLMAYSFSGKFGTFAVKLTFRRINGILHSLPKNIQVRHGDATQVIASLLAETRTGAHVCMYLDPPYYISRKDYYEHVNLDHAALPTLLRQASRKDVRWVLSYNDTPDIHRMYKGFSTMTMSIDYGYIRQKRIPKSNKMYQHATVKRTELLITDQQLSSQQRQHARALFHSAQQRGIIFR